MSIWPDPAALRAVAARIASQAGAARARADLLGRSVATTGWHGIAAQAFELEALGVVAALRSAAERLDTAAELLRRHADNVEGVLHLLGSAVQAGLAAAEDVLADPLRVADDLVSAGGDLLGDALGVVGL